MKVMAQISMIMNLDKCIGCHTCSVTCKQAWTNREGTEYIWFNNVETRPGLGYPRTWEDQEKWKGGWELTSSGKLKPKAGGRLKKLATIFHNPNLPTIQDYYEPWSYQYEDLMGAKAGRRPSPPPSRSPRSTAARSTRLSGPPTGTITSAAPPPRWTQTPRCTR